MNINKRNLDNLLDIFIFCELYVAHRDFILHRNVAKHDTLNWYKAEKVADLCNMLVKTNKAKPIDFIKTDDQKSNEVIDKYEILKLKLNLIKDNYGAKKRDQIYKAVKSFYRKKVFCYPMDNYFNRLGVAFYLYSRKLFTLEYVIDNFYFEISLFDGTKKPLKLKNVMRVYANIKENIKHYKL
jgi:hypothetical protein